MKKSKFTFCTLLVSIALVFAMLLSGCEYLAVVPSTISVVSIEKTSTDGLIDTYTITYSDDTTSTFEIKNGSDGQNGSDGSDGQDAQGVTIEDIYQKYVEEYGETTYDEFLQKYFQDDSDDVLFEGGDNTTVINKCLQSSMKVYSEFAVSTTSGFGPYQTSTKSVEMSSGSAVVYDIQEEYTYVVTNYHVIYNVDANADNGGKIARKVVAYLYGSEDFPLLTDETVNEYSVYDYGDYAIELQFVGGSIINDIAVLKVETDKIKAINPHVKEVEIADAYYVGETAIAIGNAEDEGISATEGIISVDNETISLAIDNTSRTYRSIRIDTAIYHGNSGGGLFNRNGELIGITNAGDEADQNVNYAVPLEIVTAATNSIIYYDNDNDVSTNGVYKILLGVTVRSLNSKYIFDETKGYGNIFEEITVDSINANSIIESMGVTTGDILVALTINQTDYQLYRSFDISDRLLTLRVGDEISIKYIRAGNETQSTSYVVKSADLIAVA